MRKHLSLKKILVSLVSLVVLDASPVGADLGTGTAAAENSAAAGPQVLRVCTDPDNLPFSKDSGKERGVYVELAELIGQRLSLKVEYTWWLAYNQKRTLRNTLLAGDCDAYVALPAEKGSMGKKVSQTKPFLTLSYAIVTLPGSVYADVEALRGKRVGVQFGSTPQIYFASSGGVETTTEKTAEELLKDLEKNRIDAAFLWGPEAGYLNKTAYAGKFHVQPVTGANMTGEVAIGVRAGRDDLLAKLNETLDGLKPEIAKLVEKYGFPMGSPFTLADSTPAPKVRHAGTRFNPLGVKPSLVIRVTDQQAAADAAPQDPNPAHGQTVFNNHCSHCHAKDGKSPLSERDLRRLKARYSDKWPEVAEQTIIGGRVEAGMPTWAGVLSDQEVASIIGFLATVQN